MSRVLPTVLAAALGLAGSLAATLFLFHAAQSALDRVLDERLRGAGESAALLLAATPATHENLLGLMKANALDGTYLLDRQRKVLADAGGGAGKPADLLRVDPDRVERAFAGSATVEAGYSLGDLVVTTGYFPVRRADRSVAAVLGLEAGQSFSAARGDLLRARTAALLLSVLAALALCVLAARWTSLQRVRRQEAEQAARGDSIARMGAMVAHEIRNPLLVIRATVELMCEASVIPQDQREKLDDVLGEVERLSRLTEDFLLLGRPDRPLALAPVDLAAVLSESARAAEAAFRGIQVRLDLAELPPVPGDAHRLRQVFANLLSNAAQAQEQGEIEVRGALRDSRACLRIHDAGPGIPSAVREKLFDPFLTTKAGGTGLGLAVAKMLVERHGGTLQLLDDGRPGTTFEIRLPLTELERRPWPASS